MALVVFLQEVIGYQKGYIISLSLFMFTSMGLRRRILKSSALAALIMENF